MKNKKKAIQVSLGLMIAIISLGFIPTAYNRDASKWVKVIVSDTMNVPIQKVWELSGTVNLEEVAGDRKYDNLPKLERTKNIAGDFSKEGDSRIVYFSTGDTLVETIIAKKAPYIFGYEITKASLPMKRAVHNARGVFEYAALNSTTTITKWTYLFNQKNFIMKFFIKRYINNTHKAWMQDMLKTTKNHVEKAYKAGILQETSNI